MSSIHEQFSEQFFRYEMRGRGWHVYDQPVTPEPPFEPFEGYLLAPVVDDGRRATVGSSFLSNLSRMLSTREPAPTLPPPLPPSEPEPESLGRDEDLVELQTILPSKLDIARDAFSSFLSHLSVCEQPIAFEIIANSLAITAQFVVHP